MTRRTIHLLRQFVVVLAPTALIVGIAVSPYVSDWSDEAEITREIGAASGRALTSDTLAIVYCALGILAVFAIIAVLREREERR